MELAQHLDTLRLEGELLQEAVDSAELDAVVPACEGWQLHDLLRHVGFVHRWATAHLAGGLAERLDAAGGAAIRATEPADEGLRAWYGDGLLRLVEVLASTPDDLACWSFLPAPNPRAFWARRQAHETAIHRVDAEQAAGLPIAGFDPAFAADGIDELLTGFLARRPPAADAGPLPAVLVEAGDTGNVWTLRLGQRGLETRRISTGRADLALRGSAASLYLVLWNRLPPAAVECSGAEELLGLWRERYRIG